MKLEFEHLRLQGADGEERQPRLCMRMELWTVARQPKAAGPQQHWHQPQAAVVAARGARSAG